MPTMNELMQSLGQHEDSKQAVIESYATAQKALGSLSTGLYQDLQVINTIYASLFTKLKNAYQAWSAEPEGEIKDAELETLRQVRAYLEPIATYLTHLNEQDQAVVAQAQQRYNTLMQIDADINAINNPE